MAVGTFGSSEKLAFCLRKYAADLARRLHGLIRGLGY